MNSKSDTIDVKELVDFMQGVVYEYGRGQKHSPEYSEEDFGSSFNTKAFCKRKAKEIQALLLRERSRCLEELLSIVALTDRVTREHIADELDRLESELSRLSKGEDYATE